MSLKNDYVEFDLWVGSIFHIQVDPEPVLDFEDLTVVNGWLHIMRDADELCDFLAAGGRDRCPHFFDQIFSMESSLASCKETLLAVHTKLRPDFSSGVVLNDCKYLYALTLVKPCFFKIHIH